MLCEKNPQTRQETRDSVFRNILEQTQQMNTEFATFIPAGMDDFFNSKLKRADNWKMFHEALQVRFKTLDRVVMI